MELIYWYAVGATLIAIMSLVDLYHPVMAKHEMSKDTRVLYYMVWFIISVLAAPALLYPCFNQLKGLEFRDALEGALFNKV